MTDDSRRRQAQEGEEVSFNWLRPPTRRQGAAAGDPAAGKTRYIALTLLVALVLNLLPCRACCSRSGRISSRSR